MKGEDSAAPPARSPHSSATWTILWVWLIAGTLDISDALIFNGIRGITPTMIFQRIASGLIGMRSFHEGAKSVVLGVALHYFIALIWTAVFYLIIRTFRIVRRHPIPCGLLYGGLVYVIMNFVVLPLSRVPHARAAVTLASRINGVLALLFCIGLTISLLMRRRVPG